MKVKRSRHHIFTTIDNRRFADNRLKRKVQANRNYCLLSHDLHTILVCYLHSSSRFLFTLLYKVKVDRVATALVFVIIQCGRHYLLVDWNKQIVYCVYTVGSIHFFSVRLCFIYVEHLVSIFQPSAYFTFVKLKYISILCNVDLSFFHSCYIITDRILSDANGQMRQFIDI